MQAVNENGPGVTEAPSDIGAGTRYLLFCWLRADTWGILSVFGAPIPGGVIPRQRVIASSPDPDAVALTARGDGRDRRRPYVLVE